jgi:hypothetical protein
MFPITIITLSNSTITYHSSSLLTSNPPSSSRLTIFAANGALTLLTTRLNSSTQSTAELETTQKNLHHGSFRFRARVIGPNNTAASPGACAGLFTFYDDSNESDVEILTKDPEDVYRYTNQPSLNKEGNTVPAASIEGTDLPPWSEWHTHRIDWLCKTSNWYLDDGLVASNTYSVPREPSGLIMNLWSDGGEWSWEMGIGEEVWLEVEWVEAVFDTSGPVDGPGKGKRGMEGCETVCKVDGVKEVGVPEVVEAPTSGGGREGLRRWGLVVVGALVVSLWSEGSGLRGVVSLQ